MNERIKELVFQAAEDCMFEPAKPSVVVKGEGGIYKMEIPNIFVEKFTKLIVRECILAVDDATECGEYYQNQIKQHFGVEE